MISIHQYKVKNNLYQKSNPSNQYQSTKQVFSNQNKKFSDYQKSLFSFNK